MKNKLPTKKQLDEVAPFLQQAIKGMGFVPNSLRYMAHKPNVLSSFSLFFGNVRGFSGASVPLIRGLQLLAKNVWFSWQAKRRKQEEVPLYLKNLVAHMSSNAAGCRYCQAHTAYEAHHNGVAIEKIQTIWDFEDSTLFDKSEKAALRFAWAAASVPNAVTEAHHQALQQHYTEAQIVEIIATIALFGFLNRWNDSMGTPLETLPLNFAETHLKSTGWQVGKHTS
jgi:alkylhydroperoxidase family enzyme